MLNIRGLTRRFGSITALAGIDLDVHAGEVFALLGGSGSGKTTLLRCIAGFERPDSGNIDMLGENLLRLPPYKRPLNTMFQSYALFPHMTVAGNIAFGLRHLDRTARTRRVDEMLELVRLQGLGNRRPDQLSGGQRQRVALARALARRPALLLLDEPLSALDRALREGTRAELLELQRRLGTTFIVVTHDQEEALGMATRIGIMQEGRLVQVGSPAEVYERPVNRFVAAFLGAANILSGIVVSADQVRVGEVTVSCVPGSCRSVGASVFLAVRPERIALGQADNTVRGRLRDVAYRGDAYVLTVASEAGMDLRVIADTSEVAGLTPGCSVLLGWLPASTIVLSDSNE